ncbi:MAG: cupin domain-containing protein [Thermoplasmatales archaeon]|jgi:quercetin dioxygenase-like cupin family protein|nr:cupin domain-containing protein [Candidatus Thermoplasmatota archaeon]MDA8055871.1 cupin domain-containing protein [Thermoplasmatales archaeon]
MVDLKKLPWDKVKSEELSKGLSRKLIYGDKVMVAEVRLKKGVVVPEHHHVSEQLTWIVKGELLFEIDGKKITVKEGDVLVIPSNKPHKATAMLDTIDMDMFSPIRDDWLTGNDQYLRGGKS